MGNLREEVTAVLQGAKIDRNDNVILVLNTGGGTVTGYGLAAAQLCRLKEAGIKLTVVVEQVAASGGYMMACTADKIIASPFAVLGSIGVISEQPNVYERLKKEGVEFQTITAGKYKRTLTPFKKPTQEDIKKSQEDIGNILVLFKEFVKTNRPSLNIEEVATGETWFGPDALERNLCDELKTLDDVLLNIAKDGGQIYSVKYEPPPKPIKLFNPSASASMAYKIALSFLLLDKSRNNDKVKDVLNLLNIVGDSDTNYNNININDYDGTGKIEIDHENLLDSINQLELFESSINYDNHDDNVNDNMNLGGFAMDLDATTRYKL